MFYQRYITGVKFEQHHFNIFRHILDSVICLCVKTICDVISFLNKYLHLCGTREDISEKKTPLFVILKGLLILI